MTGRLQVYPLIPVLYTPTSLTDSQISVTITGDGGCISSDSSELTILNLPTVEVSLSDSVICLGESIAVNSTSGYVVTTGLANFKF